MAPPWCDPRGDRRGVAPVARAAGRVRASDTRGAHRPTRPRARARLRSSAVPGHVRKGQYGATAMRLLVARCEVLYTGRLTARLPEAVRLLMLKADGSFLVHDDAGGYRPLNWMTPPTVVEETRDVLVVRKRAGKSEDRLEIRIVEVLSDV